MRKGITMKAPGKKVARVILALVLVPLLAIAASAAMAEASVKQIVCKPTADPCAKPAAPKKGGAVKKTAEKPDVKKPATVVSTPVTAVSSVSNGAVVYDGIPVVKDGCVEAHMSFDPLVAVLRVGVLAPGVGDIPDVHQCLGVKRPDDQDFVGWLDEHCSSKDVPSWVCDFGWIAEITNTNQRKTGSIRITKPGEYVLRLPAEYFADASKGYRVTLAAINRGNSCENPPIDIVKTGITYGNGQYQTYGERREEWLRSCSTSTIGLRWFDFSTGSRMTRVYPNKAAAPKYAPTYLYFQAYGSASEEQAR